MRSNGVEINFSPLSSSYFFMLAVIQSLLTVNPWQHCHFYLFLSVLPLSNIGYCQSWAYSLLLGYFSFSLEHNDKQVVESIRYYMQLCGETKSFIQLLSRSNCRPTLPEKSFTHTHTQPHTHTHTHTHTKCIYLAILANIRP